MGILFFAIGVLLIFGFKFYRNDFVPIIILYLISYISFYIVPQFDQINYDLSLSTWLLYSGSIVLTLIPLKKINLRLFNRLDTGLIKKFLLLSFPFILFAVIYLLPYAIAGISVNAYDLRTNLKNESLLPSGILTTIAVGICFFNIYYLFIFFIGILYRFPWYYQVISFLGSISYIVNSFAFAARDGIVVTFILSTIFIKLFTPYFSKKSRRVTYVIFFISIITGLTYIYSVTTDRFGSTNEDIFAGTFSYISQQPAVFNTNIVERDFYYGLDLRFPLISSIFTGEVKEFDRSTPYEWMFGTWLADMYSISGFWSLFVFLFVLSIVFPVILKSLQQSSIIAYLLFSLLIVQLLVQGVFYFRLGNQGGNLFLIIMVFVIFYFYKIRYGQIKI
jgi:oligosaccharide repeat unit polymerase